MKTARWDARMYTNALMASAGFDALAAAWLFLSGFVFHHGNGYLFANNVTCGALAAILAFGAFAHVWFAWLPAAIGMWVMISPFVLGFANNTAAMTNNFVTGLVILVLALRSWSVTRAARDAGVMDD